VEGGLTGMFAIAGGQWRVGLPGSVLLLRKLIERLPSRRAEYCRDYLAW
jgi:hypothetical protein